MNKEQRLKNESAFQDKRVLHKEDRRFITDYVFLFKDFNNILSSFVGKKILNIGCGTGTLTLQLAEKNEMVAIDISSESIKVLKKSMENKKVNAKALLMDAEELNFKDNSFDVIYGVAILHHLDLKKAIPGMKRVLKQNGSMFFIEPTNYNPFVNRYRGKTPHMRSKFEHPLGDEDFSLIKHHFPEMRIAGYNILQTTMPGFVKYGRKFKGFRKLLGNLDNFLTSIFPFLRKYGYSVIIEMR